MSHLCSTFVIVYTLAPHAVQVLEIIPDSEATIGAPPSQRHIRRPGVFIGVTCPPYEVDNNVHYQPFHLRVPPF